MASYRDFDIADAYRTRLWRFDFAQTMPSPGPSAGPDLLDGDGSEATNAGTAQNLPKVGLLDLWRRVAPSSVRKKAPPNVSSWVRRHGPG
jgi:hypothetical protein